MCIYCQLSIDFRERGPFSGEAAKRVHVVHICTKECKHGKTDFPWDFPGAAELARDTATIPKRQGEQ